MDKFAALNAFVNVVEHGSFAAAARALGTSRAQINRQVINLEDALGVELLHRTTRSVTLTPMGESYYKRCSALLRELRDADHEVQQEQAEPQGEIRINAPQSFGVRRLAPALVEFLRLYPKISIQLALSDQFVDPLSEGIDVTLRISARKEHPSLIAHEIIEARRVLCAAPAFLGQHGTPRHPMELAGFSCLHYGNLPTGNAWRLEKDGESVDVRVNGLFCANNADVLCEAAIAGMGIALLPLFIAHDALRAGDLVTVLDDYHAPRIYLSLVYAPSRNMSTKIRLFVKFMQQWFTLSDF
ncbi:MAG TPA: LysR substrate-binding domain-containing protein [Hyphomicrobiales bacterium]|nr:LysR substrate-binding domain-containing protein [Hyphomicrobiales bacterium]